MELGKAKLLRTGLNALYQAMHPVHGLAWTDGRQVVLTALHLDNEEPKFGNSVVIGQFDHVQGLYWGPVFANDIPALLAVQHKKHITIWQLYYNPLEKNKLVVSQTCEVGEPFPVLPQGCVWHPSKEILVILTKRDASVLYSVRSDNANVKADIKSSGIIHCACWTKDGSRMVLAIGSALHSYIWDDDQKTLSACSFCPVFDIDAIIYTVEPIVDYQVAVTTKIPPEKIYGHNMDTDLYLQSSLMIFDAELPKNNRRKSTDSEKSEPVDVVKSSSLVPANLTHLLAKHRKSDPSPLLHLRHRDFASEMKLNSSNLIIVSFERYSTTTRKVTIPGISVPDILALDPHAQKVAVASNTCKLILVYPITLSSIPNIQQIKLEDNERPKGICFLTDKLLLILVGKQKSSDLVFLPLCGSDKYMIHLITKELMPIENSLPTCNGRQHFSPGKKTFCEDHTVSRELLLPGNIGIQSPCVRNRFAEVVRRTSWGQSPTSSLRDFDENKIVTCVPVENFDAESTNRGAALMNQWTLARKLYSSSSRKLCLNDTQEICHSLGNNTAAPDKEENPSDNGVTDKRSILLCQDKLQLRRVQEIFNLTNIEMKFGSLWIILTEDGEGFVPLTFRASQEVVIRDANDKVPVGFSQYCADPIGSTQPSNIVP
ncbi:WD repeat and coiled-coil-containing protein-like isoform X2 [Ascaphus truei]|uniref:WD repeat and coiled-coil-containing protein-like isoform X2 n=1 Tax=Ascaphus truei TaxID=8439 RepID=UPI003F59A41B